MPVQCTIDQTFGLSLIGLRITLPPNWGGQSDLQTDATVVAFDPTQQDGNYFIFQQDGIPDKRWGIRYEGVRLYAKREQQQPYNLPTEAPLADDRSYTEHRHTPTRRLNLDDSSDDDSQASYLTRTRRANKRRRRARGQQLPPEQMEEEENNNEQQQQEVVDQGVEVRLENVAATLYALTNAIDWEVIDAANTGRDIQPIPYEGDQEEFTVNLTEEQVEDLKDDNGDIRYWKIMEWMLPKIDDVPFFEFMAARMRNYMVHIINTQGYKPRYYNPSKDKVITRDHITRFFGCQCARMLRGHPAIEKTWSTRESLVSVGTAMESMPMAAFEDMHRCIHFADDWEVGEGEEWDDVFRDNKHDASPELAKHLHKCGDVADAFNTMFKKCVKAGRRITFDESREAGWYNSPCTIGPEPKPDRTGATLHSMCVTDGILATYKLHARLYGGKKDGDLSKTDPHTGKVQKWVNLFSIMLHDYKGKGHCVTADSAYMGDIMCLIGRYEWLINMVGTIQSNRTGADIKQESSKLKRGTYKTVTMQHKSLPLTVCAWADNGIVKTISNAHSPKMLQEGSGLKRRKRGEDGKREKHQSPVQCPEQMKEYCETFDRIDKGNGVEKIYSLAPHTKKHNWSPKIVFRYVTITMNNAYRIYLELTKKYTADHRILDMDECVQELTHAWCQRGESMRKQRPEHPSFTRDISSVFGWEKGRKLRKSAEGVIAKAASAPKAALSKLDELRKRQKKSPWRVHQSLPHKSRGYCCWENCPGIATSADGRGTRTHMHCEECTAMNNGNRVHLCNHMVGGKPSLCHIAYHEKYFNKKYD